MPVDVTMKEPWARVICNEPECHLISWVANADCIAANGIHEVEFRLPRNFDYIEIMLYGIVWALCPL